MSTHNETTANPHPLDAAARDELARFRTLLNEFEFAVQNETRAEERDARSDRLARASDKVDAARAALLAAVGRGAEDTARIEWLEQEQAEVQRFNYKAVVSGDRFPAQRAPGLRQAIDAARSRTPTGADDAE